MVIIRHNETAPVDHQKEFEKSSLIRTCSAYLDENDVMRIKGRIDACPTVPESIKRPIILSRLHYVTHLIVYSYHKQYKHLNHQTVLNEIRQKYWIPNLRSVLNNIRNNCQKCKNTPAYPKIPEMAQLPFELHGSSNAMKPLGDFTDADALKNSWKTAQVMADKFWRTFVSEYLPTLVKRPKWFKKVTPLKVNDIVLVADENFKRKTCPKELSSRQIWHNPQWRNPNRTWHISH